jgi:hypothetical protein
MDRSPLQAYRSDCAQVSKHFGKVGAQKLTSPIAERQRAIDFDRPTLTRTDPSV